MNNLFTLQSDIDKPYKQSIKAGFLYKNIKEVYNHELTSESNNKALSLMLSLLRIKYGGKINELQSTIERMLLISGKDDQILRKNLAKITALARIDFQAGERTFGLDPIDVINIETILGHTNSSEEGIWNEVTRWVSNKDHIMIKADKEEDEVLKQMSSDWVMPGILDLEDPTLYFSPGSMTGEKMNKTDYTLKYPDKIKSMLEYRGVTNAIVIEKLEQVKVRPFINCEPHLHFQLSVIYEYMARMIKPTSLGLYNLMSYEERQSTLNDMKLQPFKLSMDQSNFDQHVSMRQILKVLNKVREFIPPNHHYVLDNAIYNIQHTMVHYKGRTKLAQGGLLSGWRITSILGSILNCLQTRTCALYADVKITKEMYQGDDVVIGLISKIDGLVLINTVDELGLEVSLAKTLLHQDVFEFLRKLYIGQDVARGYFQRTLSSILFNKPWSDTVESTISDRITTWRRVSSRLLIDIKSIAHFIEWDLVGLTNLKRTHVKAALMTSQSIGGLGVLANNQYGFRISEELLQDTDSQNVVNRYLSRLAGFDVEFSMSQRERPKTLYKAIEVRNESFKPTYAILKDRYKSIVDILSFGNRKGTGQLFNKLEELYGRYKAVFKMWNIKERYYQRLMQWPAEFITIDSRRYVPGVLVKIMLGNYKFINWQSNKYSDEITSNLWNNNISAGISKLSHQLINGLEHSSRGVEYMNRKLCLTFEESGDHNIQQLTGYKIYTY